jgi:hypothetical protein
MGVMNRGKILEFPFDDVTLRRVPYEVQANNPVVDVARNTTHDTAPRMHWDELFLGDRLDSVGSGQDLVSSEPLPFPPRLRDEQSPESLMIDARMDRAPSGLDS